MSRRNSIAFTIGSIVVGVMVVVLFALIFYALGVPARNATIAGALVVSILCKVADLAIALKGGMK